MSDLGVRSPVSPPTFISVGFDIDALNRSHAARHLAKAGDPQEALPPRGRYAQPQFAKLLHASINKRSLAC
jgi:hypothetical protein